MVWRIYVENCLVDFLSLYLPYKHQTDHDRVTHLVIHLDRVGIQVACTKGNLLHAHERIHPPESFLQEVAAVFSEEHHYPCLIRFNYHQAA